MADGNHNLAFSRFVQFVLWVREQSDLFTARQVASLLGITERNAYRYVQAMKQIDDGLQGEAGVGYLYRGRK